MKPNIARLWLYAALLLFCLGCQGPGPSETVALPTSMVDSPTPVAVPTRTPTVISTPSPAPATASPPTRTAPPAASQISSAGLYLFAADVGYLQFELDQTGMNLEMLSSAAGEGDSPIAPAGRAVYLSFAPYADAVIYWLAGSSGELWLSDLALKNNQRLFSDETSQDALEFNYFPDEQLTFQWSPSERYVVLDFADQARQDMLLDRQHNQLEPWGYTCDRIARSPQSGGWAVWCPDQTSQAASFAVFESDDRLWFSDLPPQENLVQRGERSQPVWQWSRGGDRLAFYDPSDPAGTLYVASVLETRPLLPGASPWLAQALRDSQPSPLQWSQDGKRLLVFARNLQGSCPPYQDFGGNLYHDVPCWQVIDSTSGAVLWTIENSITQIESAAAELFPTLDYLSAALSADGSYVAVSYLSGGWRNLFVADIATGQVVATGEPFAATAMRWESE